MKLASLKNRERWERWLSNRQKHIGGLLRPVCESRPIFVLGKQRSGTTMLMHAFHRHPDLLVYDEHRNSAAFDNFRLRPLDKIQALVNRARFPFVCFKPICDSHLVRTLLDEFPGAHCIWMYRDYRDVANSSIRKFTTASGAVRLLCSGRPAEGWFQEGISPSVAETLRRIEDSAFSEFDYACLTWWVRNRIVIESGLIGDPRLSLLKYEALVTQPVPILNWLFDRAGICFQEETVRNISPRFIRRNPAPALHPEVQALCEAALRDLDRGFRVAGPSGEPVRQQSAVAPATTARHPAQSRL